MSGSLSTDDATLHLIERLDALAAFARRLVSPADPASRRRTGKLGHARAEIGVQAGSMIRTIALPFAVVCMLAATGHTAWAGQSPDTRDRPMLKVELGSPVPDMPAIEAAFDRLTPVPAGPMRATVKVLAVP